MAGEECNPAFEWCPLPKGAVPGIQTTEWELTSAILIIVFNAAEFVLSTVFWSVIITPLFSNFSDT